jgi:alkaline phosphatase
MVQYQNVSSISDKNKVSTILQWAQEAGKDTGFASTTRATHATPGALYAQTVDRDWECDSKMSDEAKQSGLHDIAWQLVHQAPGNGLKVILGGGRPALFPPEVYEERYGSSRKLLAYNYADEDWQCPRNDGANLVQEWLDLKAPNAKFVDNLKDLDKIDAKETDYLMGLFAETHVAFDDVRDPDLDPSLTDMTRKAIQILSKSEQGFFLMVEGGRIDHAHHENWASRALYETLAFDQAVETAMKMIDTENTLVIVTSDQSHTLTMSGYSKRGSDIRGLSSRILDDGLPNSILNYANGPSYYQHNIVKDGNVSRLNLTTVKQELVNDPEFRYPSGGIWGDESHGGEDVTTYAVGPMAHLFQTTHEQTYIAYVMSYAACIGPLKHQFSNRCGPKSKEIQGNWSF